MTAVPAAFLDEAKSLGLAFDPGDLERFAKHLDLLLGANERFNLTAIVDRDAAWMRHVLDSLTLLPIIASLEVPVDAVAPGDDGRRRRTDAAPIAAAAAPTRPATTLADIGSGGGFPGIPLAIAMPALRVTLVEATGKKARFLEETIAALGLANVAVVAERAERLAADRAWRERFDVVVARAVGRLPRLLGWTVPLAVVGGTVLAIKGAQADAEIAESKKALHALHAAVLDVVRTPTGRIVVIEKRRRSPRGER